MNPDIAAAIIAAGSAILSAFLTMYFTRRRDRAEIHREEAEAAELVAEAAVKLMDPLVERIDALEKDLGEQRRITTFLARRVAQLEGLRIELWRGATMLAHQVMDLGHDPVYIPPMWVNGNTTPQDQDEGE